MVKIQQVINGILETKNRFIDSLEKAIEFLENHPDAYCRIFDESGQQKHERHAVGTVTIDVPASLSVSVN